MIYIQMKHELELSDLVFLHVILSKEVLLCIG